MMNVSSGGYPHHEQKPSFPPPHYPHPPPSGFMQPPPPGLPPPGLPVAPPVMGDCKLVGEQNLIILHGADQFLTFSIQRLLICLQPPLLQYVGNLDPRVNEVLLAMIFSTVGELTSAKIISDRSAGNPGGGFNFGFLEFLDPRSADLAIQALNGKRVYGYELRVNRAFRGNNPFGDGMGPAVRNDSIPHVNVFVGDLALDANDLVLSRAFAHFSSVCDARVMWDTQTGKSRGYGFVSFRDRAEAERAIATMNNEMVGGRPIRVNWATQKQSAAASSAMGGGNGDSFGHPPSQQQY